MRKLRLLVFVVVMAGLAPGSSVAGHDEQGGVWCHGKDVGTCHAEHTLTANARRVARQADERNISTVGVIWSDQGAVCVVPDRRSVCHGDFKKGDRVMIDAAGAGSGSWSLGLVYW